MKIWSVAIVVAFLLNSVPYPAYGMRMLAGASRHDSIGPEDEEHKKQVLRAVRAAKGLEPANEFSGTVTVEEFKKLIPFAFDDDKEVAKMALNKIKNEIIGAVSPGFREILIKELLSSTEGDANKLKIATLALQKVINSRGQPAEGTLEILLELQNDLNPARSVFAELAPEILASKEASEEVKGKIIEYYEPLAGASEEELSEMFATTEFKSTELDCLADVSLFFENEKPRLGIKEGLKKLDGALSLDFGKILYVVAPRDELIEEIEKALGIEECENIEVITPFRARSLVVSHITSERLDYVNVVADGAYKRGWYEPLEEKAPLRIRKIGKEGLRLVLFAVVDGFAPEVSPEYERYLGMFLANNRIKNSEEILVKIRNREEFDWAVEMSSEDLEARQRTEQAYQEGETVVTI